MEPVLGTTGTFTVFVPKIVACAQKLSLVKRFCDTIISLSAMWCVKNMPAPFHRHLIILKLQLCGLLNGIVSTPLEKLIQKPLKRFRLVELDDVPWDNIVVSDIIKYFFNFNPASELGSMRNKDRLQLC